MKELENLDEYLEIAKLLAHTARGRKILEGDESIYLIEFFRDDIEEALRQLNIEFANIHVLKDYAANCASDKSTLRPLHEAITNVCQRIIERHTVSLSSVA